MEGLPWDILVSMQCFWKAIIYGFDNQWQHGKSHLYLSRPVPSAARHHCHCQLAHLLSLPSFLPSENLDGLIHVVAPFGASDDWIKCTTWLEMDIGLIWVGSRYAGNCQ